VATEPPSDDRYRRGERRTQAEPLTASWKLDTSTFRAVEPATEDGGRHATPQRRRPRGFVWRVYALPILVIVTILVVVNTARHDGTTSGPAPGASGTPTPVVTEQPALVVPAGTGTAVLPVGLNVTQVGAGTWHVVPGNGPVVGRGTHVYHYQVAVEDGIDPAGYGGDDAFAADVAATLADPRSWVASGTIALQRVDSGYPHPDFIVSLTTPNTDHRPDLCGFQIPYEASCWRSSAHRVVIDLARWVRGALAFDGDLGLYRQYAINHEVGHVFGNQHVGCTTNGGLAPVMMQQSFGVSDDYVHDLNQVDPANRDRVARDGKVCRPNAWPYPQGPGDPAAPPPS
jgi:hypothetical protein